jgi:hypothetical protein
MKNFQLGRQLAGAMKLGTAGRSNGGHNAEETGKGSSRGHDRYAD